MSEFFNRAELHYLYRWTMNVVGVAIDSHYVNKKYK